MDNLRLAARRLARSPFVTLAAVVSLALGIGANAAMFSLFDQLVLRPLPVVRPGELVNLDAPGPKLGSRSATTSGGLDSIFSYPMFRDLERLQSCFEGMAAHRLFQANVSFRGESATGQGLAVSGGYFPVLGVKPALGRVIGASDAAATGGGFVAVVSHDFWRSRLNGDEGIVGQVLTVNGQPMTIVGVAQEGFRGTTVGAAPQVYVPITMYGLMLPGWKGFEDRRNYWTYVFARLKPGVSMEQAAASINAVYKPIVNDVEVPLQRGMSEQTLAVFREKEIRLSDGSRGQSSVQAEARTPLLLLFAATGIVLLIACTNVAGLLLARGMGRSTEMAVRLSIGASRWHLVRQLLAESTLLAVLGGAAGLLVARWTLQLDTSLVPAWLSGSLVAALDQKVLLFAAAVTVFTGTLFGLAPALHSTRADLVTIVKGSAGQPSGARSAARFRTGLVTLQIALAMTLLVSAGLFTRSLVNVSRIVPGIDTSGLVIFTVTPLLSSYTPTQSRSLFERLEQELGRLPGVESVAASTVTLFAGDTSGTSVSVEGFEAGPDTDRSSLFMEVSAGYFETLGIPLLSGREFTRDDVPGRPKVAVVNEAFASKFNLGRNAVGRHMGTSRQGGLEIEIVGVVKDVRYAQLKEAPPPTFYLPLLQNDQMGFATFYVRGAGSGDQVLGAIPAVVRRLDANLPVENLRTMESQIRENVFTDRLVSVFSAGFAGLATLLAAIGLYGVLAYTFGQRTREIGLRMALGADAGSVRAMVLRQVAFMTAIGGTVGLLAAIALGRAARSLLFGLDSHDPGVLALSAITLSLVALGAGLVPAWRASRIEPMRALRWE
ncbi:MAG: ABC transporter permease [Vicinamibacterales bacterium]